MKVWAMTLLEATLLKNEAFLRLIRRNDAFALGFLTILLAALIGGLPVFIADLVGAARPQSIEADISAGFAEAERNLRSFLPMFGDLSSAERQAVLDQIEEGMELAVGAVRDVAALPRPLPQPTGEVFEAIGRYTSRPFADTGIPLAGATLATWLGYGIWVMLFAKLLGGRATLAAFFAATAVFAVPFVLQVFGVIPALAPVVTIIAFVWAIVIYIKATAVSHEFGAGQAVLAMLLPIVIVIIAAALLAAFVAALIGLGLMGN